ncbi:restriction endonuclease subunit S (plasmid) [Bacillus wiedmannii]|uniref:restriction endonuclease subunit S n=1 Tax=Bacillus wiedmannii TaxID=1890302 RepID=UPI001C026703|nr:restriction endonuclease subunit S [Bacillus wiedmannii]QWH69640.1 restriction endonuclease subunit S [Bacillus wiedmannii]
MNVPKLRFSGFTGDWEERKLNEASSYSNGGSYENDVRSSGKYQLVTLKSVDMAGNLVDSGKYIDKEVPTLSKGTLVMILSEQAPGLLGMTAQIPENNKYVLNQRVAEIKPNNNTDSYFLSMAINRCQRYFSKRGAGTKVQNITKGNVENFEFYCPIIKEQQKIGCFFKTLDKKIQLQQQKIDLLQEQKKGFLQIMFPKAGEIQPQVRFAGFTDDWEQRKLGEVTNRIRGNDGRMDLPTLTISASQGWLDQRERFSGNIAGKEQKNYTLLKKGQLSYNHGNSKLAKYGVVFELDTYEEALVPRVYHSFETNELADSKFIQYMFETKRTDKELGKLISSGARMDGLLNINYDEFMGIKISLPNIEEQQKIGAFFKQLDDTIALHQRKVDLYKEQKKGFMQQMFI